MKKFSIKSSLIIISSILFSLIGCNNKTKDKVEAIEDTSSQQKSPYNNMRNMSFDITPEQLQLSGLNENEIYGVIMDWDLGNGTMSLISFSTGDASMYLSTGGGVIGGGQHPNVSSASKLFVKQAQKYLDKTIKMDSTPLPSANNIRFYFKTTKGIYSVEEKMSNIENQSSEWYTYFEEANKLIAELRKTTEKTN